MIKPRLIKLLSHTKKYVLYQVLWQWIALLAQILIIFSTARLLQRVPGISEALPYALAIIFCILVRYLCDGEYVRASANASADVKRILREKIFEKLLRLGPSYREDISSAEALQLATEGVEQLEVYFGKYLSQFVYALLAPLTLFLALFHISHRAAVTLLVCVPLIPVTIVIVMKIGKRLLSRYWGSYAKLGDSFLENLQGLTTLKIYRADAERARAMDRESERFRSVTMKVLSMQLNSTAVMDIIAYGGAAAGMAAAIAECAAGGVRLSDALMIVLLSAEFFLPMRLLGSYFHIAMNGMAASDKIFALLDLPEDTAGEERSLGDRVDIRLENVRFSYDGEREILKGISADLMSRSLVGIVGVSGCGKSTLASLLSGRVRGYEGSIRLNGVELSTISGKSLTEHITVAGQDPFLFQGTVRENLLMGDPNASDERMRQALRRVKLLLALDLRDGLDTRIEENGANLSGGQRQRLALARALLHDTAVYIFDEVTSNIDAESEEAILSVIRELAREKTVILISHRLANVAAAREILFLAEGNVAERGKHPELCLLGGAYAHLWERQQELERFAEPGRKSARTVRVSGGGVAARTLDGENVYAYSRGVNAQNPENLETDGKRRSGRKIMKSLIRLVRPLTPVMALAILLGCTGFACAIAIPVLGSAGALGSYLGAVLGGIVYWQEWLSVLPAALLLIALARGVLHYGEQYCNHYIAFRLLALIRHKVFEALRRLCPAKLEGREKGNLISLITSDIELLEVFYAHTISPIAIAAVLSLLMVVWMGTMNFAAAILALIAYLTVGVLIPLCIGRGSADAGMQYRTAFGKQSAFVLESLYGLDELLQYRRGEERLGELSARERELQKLRGRLSEAEVRQRSLTNLAISGFSALMLFLCAFLRSQGEMGSMQALLCTVSLMSSFGPVVALSNLSSSLSQTLAAGERVLRLLEEKPAVPEVHKLERIAGEEDGIPNLRGIGEISESRTDARIGRDYIGTAVEIPQTGESTAPPAARFLGAEAREVDFAYTDRMILKDFSAKIPEGKIVGIRGESGCGKSTFLKLLMRFWDVQGGEVLLSGEDVREMETDALRELESYVTQETWMFHDTIAENIRIGRLGATQEEVEEAARKAQIADFIESLPDGYDTMVGELGDTLSGGERQRIGLARAFLHDAPFLLLDEPTSSLDALSEGEILRALEKESRGRTIVLVSHRASTMAVADLVYEME